MCLNLTMDTPSFKPRIVRCPNCSGDSVYGPDNAYRPFCSAKCKGIDLGAWSSEEYRMAAKPDPDDPEAPDFDADVPPPRTRHD